MAGLNGPTGPLGAVGPASEVWPPTGAAQLPGGSILKKPDPHLASRVNPYQSGLRGPASDPWPPNREPEARLVTPAQQALLQAVRRLAEAEVEALRTAADLSRASRDHRMAMENADRHRSAVQTALKTAIAEIVGPIPATTDDGA
jgi:hypothetical protein